MSEPTVSFQMPLDQLLDQLTERLVSRIKLEPAQTFPDHVMSEKELCKYLGITAPTAQKWRRKGKIPFMQIGSAVRYDLTKVIAAIEKK